MATAEFSKFAGILSAALSQDTVKAVLRGTFIEIPQGLKVKARLLSRVRLFATPWIVAYQAPVSKGFSRQEYWNGLPFPSPGDLPSPGIGPQYLAL